MDNSQNLNIINTQEISPYKRAKIHLTSLWQFFCDDLLYFSASLSFYTIFALLPMLLIVFSIFASLPSFQAQIGSLQQIILENLMPMHTQVFKDYIQSFLENSAKLGFMGLIYALVTSILFFRNYQSIACKMFHSKPRNLWDSISVYWTCMSLLPLGIIFSIYVSTKAMIVLESFGFEQDSTWLWGVLPYCLVWFVFFVLFKISANRPLSTYIALIGSFISAALWSISKTIFMYYVFYNKAYATLYGSLSILLFFLLWIYLSWSILLLGMRICVHLECEKNFLRNPK